MSVLVSFTLTSASRILERPLGLHDENERVLRHDGSSTGLAIRNEMAELAILREALKRFCAQHAIGDKILMQLQVTLDEVVSNIIKYAWPEGGAHEVLVQMAVGPKAIQIEVVDDGQAFDPRSVPAPARITRGSSPRPGGIGIHMVKQLVDDVAYTRTNGRNHTTLTKRWNARARTQDE
jgi:anti-sigma regulatory factor (Ser/Thr protein kinase)